jgi:hypothetical protein
MLPFHHFIGSPHRAFALLPFLTTLFAWIVLGVAAAGDDLSWVPFDRTQFDGHTTLDDKGDVQLFWTIGDEYSTYGIASRSEGYLALGFSETGAMTGADIALGYKNSAGKFVLENRHATGFVTPELSQDQTNNVRLKEGDQQDGVTGFVFEKKNQAECLQEQVDVEVDSWQWFIYAFSDDNTFAQHASGNMGNQFVKLGTGKTVSVNAVEPVPGAKEFTIASPEITIPTQETTYCYTLHKMPAGKKNFIVGERPLSNANLLHHLVIYSCFNPSDELISMLGQKPNCDYQHFSNPCNGFVSEWAPGMDARTFKPGYGKPFGSDSYEYVMLETHFNNPEGLEGQKGAPGYKLLYSDEPVENEIGSLTLGQAQVTGWELEPGKKLVSRTNVCTPDCTKDWPSDGITAVSVFFHMHKHGVNAQVQIIRDGKEITPLSSIRDFEYGYQFSKSLNNIKLLPGDRLITTCQYDTSADQKPVLGGLSSQEEMCFAWVDYYPANDILICSQVDVDGGANSPLNGTVAYCLQKDEGDDSSAALLPDASLNVPYQHLAPSGNQCGASSNTASQSPSGTDSGPASASTSSVPSAGSLPVQALAGVLAPLMLAMSFMQQFR